MCFRILTARFGILQFRTASPVEINRRPPVAFYAYFCII
jgi:hypothetical protein